VNSRIQSVGPEAAKHLWPYLVMTVTQRRDDSQRMTCYRWWAYKAINSSFVQCPSSCTNYNMYPNDIFMRYNGVCKAIYTRICQKHIDKHEYWECANHQI